MDTIEINGKRYVKKPDNKSNSKSYSKYAKIALLHSMMLSPIYGYKRSYGTPNVNIVEEYRLIELKRSNLSRAQRESAIKAFKRQFIEITD